MQDYTIWGMAAMALFGSIAFAKRWYERMALPYNEQGRYFDPQNGIVLHEQQVAVYGALAIVLGVIAIVLLVVGRNLSR